VEKGGDRGEGWIHLPEERRFHQQRKHYSSQNEKVGNRTDLTAVFQGGVNRSAISRKRQIDFNLLGTEKSYTWKKAGTRGGVAWWHLEKKGGVGKTKQIKSSNIQFAWELKETYPGA